MATDLELVNNPNSDIYVLTEIAKRSPQLWSKIAQHPNCSPELAQWVGQMLSSQPELQQTSNEAKETETPRSEQQVPEQVSSQQSPQPTQSPQSPQHNEWAAPAQPTTPYTPIQIQPAPAQYEPPTSKKSNLGLTILVIFLAFIAVVSIVVAGWALLSRSNSTKPESKPAQTTETQTDTKTKDKTGSETEKDNQNDGKTDASKKSDSEGNLFDFDAMVKGDYSSANGRWEAPNGDVITIDGKIVLWEHDGKPFKAKYPESEESKVPEEYRSENLKSRGWLGFNKEDFFKIVWIPDEDNSETMIEAIFVPEDLDNKAVYSYDVPGDKDGKTMDVYITNYSHVPAILLLNLDHPETLKLADIGEYSAHKVK